MRQLCVLAPTATIATIALGGLAPSYTESAVANGDTRTLHLYHTHTFETIDATFRVNGHYDPAVLAQLNHFLRDWRNNDEHQMDPRLFDAVWEAYRTAGATDRIQIYSAYRSPQTNAMLRRRSRAVAEHSQHMLGKAMDTTMPGFPMSRIREAGMKLQNGGVGWYPSANFVHLDVGGVRSWPRMSYDQLARIFPDGKTVHISSDGRTMPGYEQARLELGQRGGDVELPPAQESSGFFAWLFGGGSGGGTAREDEEDRRAPARPVAVAAAPQAAPVPAPQPQPQPAQAEAAPQQPALAYASNEPAQTPSLDGRARIEGQQVASLETPNTAASPLVAMPLPPRRPADLVAETPEDVPLPPSRPDSLDRLQTASIRFSDAQSVPLPPVRTTSPSGVPQMRKSSLPAIITHGNEQAVADQALAFAAVEPNEEAPPVPVPVARPSNILKPVGLRSLRHRTVVAAAPVPQVVDEPGEGDGASDSLAGPKLTGLRRAAQMRAEKAAL